MYEEFLDQLNFEDFKDFVDSQDAEKTINHKYWDSCAIGDYIRDALSLEDAPLINTLATEFAYRKLKTVSDKLHKIMGNAEDYPLETYGKLNNFLRLGLWYNWSCMFETHENIMFDA